MIQWTIVCKFVWNNVCILLGHILRTEAPQVVPVVKNPTANAGDTRDSGSVPGLGRSTGGRHLNPIQYSCLENSMDRGAWWSTVHRVAKIQTWRKWLSTHTYLGLELGSHDTSIFNILKKCFSRHHIILHSHQQCCGSSSFSTMFVTFCFFFYYNHFSQCEVVLHHDFDFHFPAN